MKCSALWAVQTRTAISHAAMRCCSCLRPSGYRSALVYFTRTFGAGLLEQWINDQAAQDEDVAEALRIFDILGDIFTNLTDLTIEGEMEFTASYPTMKGTCEIIRADGSECDSNGAIIVRLHALKSAPVPLTSLGRIWAVTRPSRQVLMPF